VILPAFKNAATADDQLLDARFGISKIPPRLTRRHGPRRVRAIRNLVMAETHYDLHEIKELVAELRTDRAELKAKEQREAWTKYTSMTLVFIAVLAAVATQWSGKYSTRVLAQLNQATLNQAAASDQWSFYQAKSIKQNLAEESRESALRAGGTNDPVVLTRAEAATAKIARYDKEKAEIMAKAKSVEQLRDDARKAADEASARGGAMGLAVSIYQIAIAIGSICLVTKKKPLWFVSLLLAALATVKMVAVWLS
jgi:hypothetical protein